MRHPLSSLLVRFVTAFAVAGAAAVLLAAKPVGARVDAAPCELPYAYAGRAGWSAASGIAATVTMLDPALVTRGHIGAWVGVGGRGQGPGGSDSWLQVGFASYGGDGLNHLYYELVLPGAEPRFVKLETDVPRDASRRVAVVAERAERWSVWVDGTRRAGPFRLPGSGPWRPVATAEAWGGSSGACNRFRYSFSQVATRTRAGRWQRLTAAAVIVSRGYKVEGRGPGAFVASATF